MSDIAELFARDPLDLSTQDISAIVAHYRAASAKFEIGEKQAGATKALKGSEPKLDAKALGDLLKDI